MQKISNLITAMSGVFEVLLFFSSFLIRMTNIYHQINNGYKHQSIPVGSRAQNSSLFRILYLEQVPIYTSNCHHSSVLRHKIN